MERSDDALPPWNAPTLTHDGTGTGPRLAAAQPGLGLDDALRRRDLKARLFGRAEEVRIGRYRVVRRIGAGGMGTVYEAIDPELDRRVALKLVQSGRRHADARMMAEARALARLRHPNVVTVHEVGRDDTRVFVAMEYVEGQTLTAWLDGSGDAKRRPSSSERVRVLGQAARGLLAAHEAGVVHRDFKPDNVLIGEDGRVRIIDFGLAKTSAFTLESEVSDVDWGAFEHDLTATGQLLGTPAYMAPEQYSGGAVDARTDVFAFCVTAFEALSGRRPFDADDVAALRDAVCAGEHRPVRGAVPPGLVGPLERGLQPDPRRRPSSMVALVRALERLERPSVWPKIAVGGVLALGLGSAAYAWVIPERDEPASANASVEATDPRTAARRQDLRAMVDAHDPEVVETLGEAFVQRHGDEASPAELALVHATLGNLHWERSCPSSLQGLCARREVKVPEPSRCGDEAGPVLVRVARDPARVEQAEQHHRQAEMLAKRGVGLDDETLTQAHRKEIGMMTVARADAELERLLALEAPLDLSSGDGQSELAKSAFAGFFSSLVESAQRLQVAYSTVKGLEPRTVLLAAARTGITMRTMAVALERIPIPPPVLAEVGGRGRYCEAVAARVAQPLAQARAALAWCTAQAERSGLGDEGARICDPYREARRG